MRLFPISCAVSALFVLFLACPPASAQLRVIAADSSVVGPIWSGHPVDFSFISRGDTLYAAYYAGNSRELTVARRNPASGTWSTKTLTGAAATVGWDSHNSIVMVIDAQGLIHIAANMHNNPLRY